MFSWDGAQAVVQEKIKEPAVQLLEQVEGTSETECSGIPS